MTIHTLCADIADRIPEMARDGKLNNQQVLERLIGEFVRHEIERYKRQRGLCEDQLPTLKDVQDIYAMYSQSDCPARLDSTINILEPSVSLKPIKNP